MAIEYARMAQLVGTTADWASADPFVLEQGEIGFEILISGAVQGKVGDGVSNYSALPYTLGVGITTDTDQTITGMKTIDNELRFLSQADGTSLGEISMSEFLNKMLWVRTLEPDSDVAIQGKKADGSGYGLYVAAENEELSFGTHLIADYGGVAGRTWGSVLDTGILSFGIRYTSVRNSIGWYSLTFDDAAFNSEQCCTATIRSNASTGYTIAVDHISATQVDIHVTDGAQALADSSFDFTRHFATEAFTPPP